MDADHPPTFDTLQLSADGPVGRLTLDRPEKLNPLSTRCLDELAAAAAEHPEQAYDLSSREIAGKAVRLGQIADTLARLRVALWLHLPKRFFHPACERSAWRRP